MIEDDGKIVPDSNAVYHLEILLTTHGYDLGFFDALDSESQNLSDCDENE